MSCAWKASGSAIELRLHYWLRGRDSNERSSGYEPDELPLLHPAITCGGQDRPALAQYSALTTRLTTACSRQGSDPRADCCPYSHQACAASCEAGYCLPGCSAPAVDSIGTRNLIALDWVNGVLLHVRRCRPTSMTGLHRRPAGPVSARRLRQGGGRRHGSSVGR